MPGTSIGRAVEQPFLGAEAADEARGRSGDGRQDQDAVGPDRVGARRLASARSGGRRRGGVERAGREGAGTEQDGRSGGRIERRGDHRVERRDDHGIERGRGGDRRMRWRRRSRAAIRRSSMQPRRDRRRRAARAGPGRWLAPGAHRCARPCPGNRGRPRSGARSGGPSRRSPPPSGSARCGSRLRRPARRPVAAGEAKQGDDEDGKGSDDKPAGEGGWEGHGARGLILGRLAARFGPADGRRSPIRPFGPSPHGPGRAREGSWWSRGGSNP